MLRKDIVEGVHLVSEYYVNWYLIEAEEGVTVVDAGLPASWDSLHRALAGIGRRPEEVRAVVLTHAHFDHLGFAERARSELGVPVWVHENDVPLTRRPWMYMSERSPLAYGKSLPAVVSFLKAGVVRLRPVEKVHRFSAEEALDVPGSPRVIFTPGHTLGHCALHLPERGAMITGDALVTLDPYTGRRGPRAIARAATADAERAITSLDALSPLGHLTLLPGHGEPWTGDAAQAVEQARRAGVA